MLPDVSDPGAGPLLPFWSLGGPWWWCRELPPTSNILMEDGGELEVEPGAAVGGLRGEVVLVMVVLVANMVLEM